MKQFEDLGMTPFLKKVAFFSSGGAFLDGYVLSIIGVALTQLTPLFGLDAGWTAAIGASAFIGIFAGTIMTAFGLGSGHESILGEAVISLLFLAGTFPAMYWLNTFGRRPTLLVSLGLMAVGLLALGLWPTGLVWFIIIAFALYAFFSGAPGILQWLYPNELFPTEIRASAVGIAIGFSRIGTVAGTYLLPIALESWGLGPTMLVGAGLVGVGFVISYFCAPETRGKTLHEASQIGGVETRGATHHHTDGSSSGAARDGKQCQNVPGTGQVASNLTQMQAHHHHKPRL